MFIEDKAGATDDESTDTTDTSEGDGGDEGTTDQPPADKEGANGDDKEPRANRFFDPRKVPKELQPTYKAMQQSYTQKVQKAALSMRKAAAFDELVGNPEFQAWVASKNGQSKSSKKSSRDDDEGDDEKPDFEAMVERAVAKSIAPLVQGEHRKNAQAEWKNLLEKYPQAENYREEIADTMRDLPGTSYERAFKMAAFDDAVGLGEEGAVKSMASKKRSVTGKPSNVAVGEKPPTQAKSIPEAFQQALKAQKEKERK